MTQRLPLGVGVLSLAIFLGVSATARAESGPAPSPPSDDDGLAVYLFAGYSGWNDGSLGAPLAARGYSSFSADPGTGGLGMLGWSHGWMGELEFQLALADADGPDGRHVSLDAGQLTLHAGRVLAKRRHLRTYAMAGIGYGASSLTPGAAGPPLRGTNGVVIPAGKAAQNFALAFQSLVGVDYLLPIPGRKRGFNGLLFGLRAGYNLQPAVSSWTVSNGSGAAAATSSVALPRLADDGPFVHLVVGDIALGR
jgi:hypothetical protein